MKFPQKVFRYAGIYGLIVMIPQYFLESSVGQDYPPAVTHPEFYYGFIGVTLVFQFVFLVIATDPQRYYPLMLVAILEKLSFALAVVVLFFLQRVHASFLLFAGIDSALAALFFFARLKTAATPASRTQ